MFTYDKKELVKVQVDKACELFIDGDYICAITLAGAGGNLAKDILEAEDRDSYCEDLIGLFQKFAEKRSKNTPGKRAIRSDMNNIRNSLKHHKKEQKMNISFDAEFIAFIEIGIAIGNIELLNLKTTENMQRFNLKTKDYTG